MNQQTQESLVRKYSTHEGRLGIYVYPCGICYSDRQEYKWGDYKRVAFLDYDTLTFQPEPDANADVLAAAKRDAAMLQSRKGQRFDIDACGNCVVLGSKVLTNA
jgi:hypothetical protein